MGQKQTKLKQDALDELLLQTSFSETEIQDWYKGFLKECPAGYLSLDDFKRIYSKYFPRGEVARFAEFMFRGFDRDQDGLIDFRDFISSLNITNRGSLSQKLKWAFSVYDLDGDGYISKQDLNQVLMSIYLLIGSTNDFIGDDCNPLKRSERILRLMDTDGDDRLSLNEFITGIKSDKLIIHLLGLDTQNSDFDSVNCCGSKLTNSASDDGDINSDEEFAQSKRILMNQSALILNSDKGGSNKDLSKAIQKVIVTS